MGIMVDRTSTDKTIIDPIFKVPEEAADLFAPSRDEVDIETDDSGYEDLDVSDTDSGVVDDYLSYQDDGDEASTELVSPDSFTVFAQTLIRAPGGQQTVNVVLDIDDVYGADKYEVSVVIL